MEYKKGSYRLETFGTMTTPDYVKNLLNNLTTTHITNIEVFDNIDSTSTYLQRNEKKTDNLVAIAHTQSAGRGRGTKQFDSPPGGMYMSIYKKTTLPPRLIPFVTVASALAVYDATQNCCNITPAIKWVNDVLIGDKKICGILVNGTMTDDVLDGFIAGIGVNLNTPQNAFASFTAARASSIAALSGQETNLARYIAAVLNAFERYTDGILSPDSRLALASTYGSRLSIIDKEVTIDDHRTIYRAKCLGIDEECRLLLQLPNGEKRALASGEIITIHH